MSKTHSETNPQNDSVDSDSITIKIGDLISRLNHLQTIGNIAIVNTPLSKSDYSTALKRYSDVNTIAKKTTQFSSPDNKAAFLSDLHKCQAIIAFRAGKDASTYLKECGSISANRNDFIIELHKTANDKQNPELVKNIGSKLYYPLLNQAFNAVDLHLKSNKYDAAFNEIKPLLINCNTLPIIAKYAEIRIKEANPQKLEECLATCTLARKHPITEDKILAQIFNDLHNAFKSLTSADPKTKDKYESLAKQANECAIQHSPQEKAQDKIPGKKATLTREDQKKYDEFQKAAENKMKADVKYVTAGAQVAQVEVDNEYKEQLAAGTAKLIAELGAKKTQKTVNIEMATEAELAVIQSQSPSTKASASPLSKLSPSVQATQGQGSFVKAEDTPLNASAPPLSDLPPGYNLVSSLYPPLNGHNKFLTDNPTVPITADISTLINDVATDAETTVETVVDKAAAAAKEATEVLKTTLLENVKEFLVSSKTDIMQQIKVHCDNAIKKGINVYETVNDVKTLLVLASGFLSLNNQEKAEEIAGIAEEIAGIAEEICGKIARISQNAYETISDNKTLSLLAKKYSELGNHNSCIASCKKLYQSNPIPSEENYQLLKAIAEEITDKQCAIAILNVVEHQTKDPKQKAEACLSKGKIYLLLGNKAEATRELDNAGMYNFSIYKSVAEDTLKLMYEKTDSVSAKYCYLSKNCTLSSGDQALAARFKELGQKMVYTGQHVQKALCDVKAFLCSHDKSLLSSTLMYVGQSSPYYTKLSQMTHIQDLHNLDQCCLTLIGEIEGS